MKLDITPNMTIAYLNEVFRFFYPNLKLVFFRKTFVNNQKLSENERVLDETLSLKELSPNMSKGEIIIDDDESTANFELDFEKNFGLHVEVFRRSGALWLLTTLSDAHSLKEQEERAEMSLEKILPESEIMDYREQD